MGLPDTDRGPEPNRGAGRIVSLLPLRDICPLGSVFALLLAFSSAATQGRESPRSYGEVATVDSPILRIPVIKKPPVIDGVMEKGEWEDAAALSSFWYDFGNGDFRFLAPIQTQLQVYAAYDKDNLYFAWTSPVYPENSWLRARGRFPDVLSHPLYGALWDDHLELEIRPYHDIARGFQLGLLRWDVNPINTLCDWYWSQQGGSDMQWKSDATVRSQADGKRWVVEYAIPLKCMATGLYQGKDEQGRPLVTLPPPDGTVYRAWFVRGIGGNGPFFNAFDNHCWNTTKTQIIFDSQAPAFQINELGPIMEDVIDVRLTVKNHSSRSETVLLGFFVENAEGLIYSSYEAPELKEGMVELRPGEVRQIRLRQPLPGISTDGNVLWFDVRSAGTPAKILFRTRLVAFHSMDGGATTVQSMTFRMGSPDPTILKREVSFRERRLDVIATLRPPRKDFDLRWNFSSYAKRISVVVDKGIHGASDEAKRATQVKLTVMKNNADEDVVKEVKLDFRNDFACGIVDLPELVEGESYKLSVLLFDANQRIVGSHTTEAFSCKTEVWQGNRIGLEDVVWEPFEPIQVRPDGFETLAHRFTLAESGLPAQIYIKPDLRDLPLEKRGADATLSDADLLELGRGPQLRAPMRVEAVVNGARVKTMASRAAKLVRQWKSEVEYASKLQAGPLTLEVNTQYDCDGAMHCRLAYGSERPAKIDGLELVADVEGLVDIGFSDTGKGGMAAADAWECSLPMREGIVWDGRRSRLDMFYNRFIPWFWFGSCDRGFSWYCDTDRGWLLDKDGPAMQLERDKAGKVTWRVKFVNHPVEVKGQRTLEFAVLTHPAKPKPKNFRQTAWHYFAGSGWADGYNLEPIELPDEYLLKRWRSAASAPPDTPDEQRTTWRKDEPPFHRYGRWRNVGVCDELDQIWEEKATYWFERHIRVGRRVGWWMDEYFPVGFGRSDNLAMGNAYLRDPETVGEKELPWHSCFLTKNMRGHYKRIARVFKINNVPQRQHTWSNNAASMLESFLYNSLMVEECGAAHRSFEVDVVTQFPSSLYRYLCHNYSGLVTTVCADATEATAGDDKRLDRQHFGRALLNDIGVCPAGPHGVIHHKEQGVRLLTALRDFGFFEDQDIEKIPFWRIGRFVRVGDKPSEESRVYVTAYRRRLADGKGFKAIFVIMNENFEPIELPLFILDPVRILGGPNTLEGGDVLRKTVADAALADWWAKLSRRDSDSPVLMDLETGSLVARADKKRETYGPVYVPYHDYRVLYGQYENVGR